MPAHKFVLVAHGEPFKFVIFIYEENGWIVSLVGAPDLQGDQVSWKRLCCVRLLLA